MQSSPALTPSFSGGSDTRNLARFAETHGAELRRRIGASPEERLDLDAMMREFQVVLYKLTDIMNVSPEVIAHLQSVSPRRWSGGGQALPNGHLLVILHPFQTQERANITLMEEICHHYFGHQPTRIETNELGLLEREYHKQQEEQAYWTGAAALLPSRALAQAVYRRELDEVIAARFDVSTELVHFRIKTWNLWDEYTAYDTSKRGVN